MLFLDREEELARLDSLADHGGLGIVYGRRRIGKTRLLLEWTRRRSGLYFVADLSAPDVQRRVFAGAVAGRFPGFAAVEYPDWQSLLDRVAAEARAAGWRGPLVIDELPYLVAPSPDLPSVLQRFVDHEAARTGLALALAGSSQRLMQGLVLSPSAPLFGRARELFEVGPLPLRCLRQVQPKAAPADRLSFHAAWGGTPRYWELALDAGRTTAEQVETLVLDPLGPLHREPDLLLLEEMPPAVELRPLLDVLGAGAHRLSEAGGRRGRPATSLSRPLARLVELGLVRREIPFGEGERGSKRSLYRIADPFFRLWFTLVAPHRAQLAAGGRPVRRAIYDRGFPALAAAAFEDVARAAVPRLPPDHPLGRLGPWGPASRHWRGNDPEWDLVSESLSGDRLLLGEVKWSARPPSARTVEHELARLSRRPPPALPERYAGHRVVRALFLPAAPAPARPPEDCFLVHGEALLV